MKLSRQGSGSHRLAGTRGADQQQFAPGRQTVTTQLGLLTVLIEDAVELLRGSIELAHAKDRLSDGSFAPAGRGVLDYRHYLRVLERSGFQGALITHGLEANEAKGIAAFLKSSLLAAEAFQ